MGWAKMRKKEGWIPVLIGSVTEDGTLILVYCPYCRTRHVHGAGRDESEGRLTHRIAHCVRRDSPFHERGYNVLDPSKRTRHNRAKLKEEK